MGEFEGCASTLMSTWPVCGHKSQAASLNIVVPDCTARFKNLTFRTPSDGGV